MLKIHLTIAYRNLFHYKIYSFITIIGLAIGMASSILMLLLVKHELSFDQMHQKNIYRLYQEQHFEGMLTSQQNESLQVSQRISTRQELFRRVARYGRVVRRVD